MKHIYISVINDLVTDARAHRTCITLRKSGGSVTLIGRILKDSTKPEVNNYFTKRFKLLVNRGFLFYLLYNLRLFIYLFSRRKIDILVACDLDTLPANFIVSKLRNCELVYDSHEYFTEVPELQNRPFTRKIWIMIEGFILPRLTYAYTVSEDIAREYSDKYGVKFDVIRNLPMNKETINIYPLPEAIKKQKKIIYQGALNMGRGIEEVMEAVKLMNDVVFIIAGDGYLYRSLKRKTYDENLNEKVFFTGRLPHEKLHELTIQADIGISLEQNIGKNYLFALPNKIFDYFNAGIPVLVSNLPGIRTVVEKYGTGMVADSMNPENLKEKLEYMLYNTEARKKWEKNIAIAADELSWYNEEVKLKKLFEKTGLSFIE